VGRASTVQYKYKRALFSPSIQIKVKKMDIFGDFKKISTKNWRGAWRTKVRTQVFKLRVKIAHHVTKVPLYTTGVVKPRCRRKQAKVRNVPKHP
jgi:hypothetical protein